MLNKTLATALIAAGLTLSAAAAMAQPATPAAASTAIAVDKTPISEIIKNEKAKAALEKALPEITAYYEQIGGMTLAELAPMSQGALDETKLKSLQAEFDKLK